MTHLPEPHRLDGGDMPISWYKEALKRDQERRFADNYEIKRLKKIINAIQKLSK